MRKKEPFTPLDPDRVRMYVCGPTVYDFAHVGNARPVVVFDVLFRLLRRIYGEGHVKYVRNITDIDDKIIKAASENNEPIAALTARTEKAFHEDMAALGALAPTEQPRATEHIAGMIRMIERLIESGHAYAAEGHVLFAVATKGDYGKLSRRDRDEMIAGARVEVAPYKKDPADFVLWKPSTPEQPGWDSPWGRGRPGWHLECSVMSESLLGESFDIHGGGLDLVFPHHENEIAQSECAHGGRPFVRYWLHNGYVTVEGEKMSKSLGNFFTVRQLLEEGQRGEAIRLTLLSAHYRQPLDFSREALRQAKLDLDKLYKPLWVARDLGIPLTPAANIPSQIRVALEDDLNTPLAISRLRELATDLNIANDMRRKPQQLRVSAKLLASGAALGILSEDPERWFKMLPTLDWAQPLSEPIRRPQQRTGITVTNTTITPGAGRLILSPQQANVWIDEQIAKRNAARKAKNFAEADRIRAELEAQGIVLEDKPGGKTEWRRAG